ncbi:MAG: hypothetical protein ACF8TS_11550 [Maioricimonas sp. JB049]
MHRIVTVLVVCVAVGIAASAMAEETYPVHPDSVQKQNVPPGQVEGPFVWRSEIDPGTVRDYWI